MLSSAELSLRGLVAEVRLLRLAVDAHLGREIAPLSDPLGDGPLTVDTTDAGPRFRSAGKRGNGYLERVASLR